MDAGIDIGNDGEQRRIGFQTYVPQRMSGFAGVSKRRRGREFEEFPELLAYLMRRFPNPPKSQQGAPEAQAEIKYRDLKPITDETAGFNKIADELGAFSERFMTAASPGIISTTMLNAYYDFARRLSRRDRARDEQGIPGGAQGRADPADRRAGSRDGSHHDVPRSLRQRLRQALRAPRRRDQQGHRGHPARPRAAARLLRQLGRPAHPRHPAGEDPAGALHGQRRRADRSSSPIRATPTNTPR